MYQKQIINDALLINPSGALVGVENDIIINLGSWSSDYYGVVKGVVDLDKVKFEQFITKNVWSIDECGAYISYQNTYARMSSSICGSTLDEVKSYFSNNPVIMNYVLANPVFEPFADQSLPYLSTYDGATNISNDDALSAEMTVKYPTTDASGIGSRNESRIVDIEGTVGSTDISDIGDGTITNAISMMSSKLGGLTFSASGTTLSITDGTNTWTLEANS